MIAGQQRWALDDGPTGSIFSCRTKDCGMSWTTSHNKAAVRGLVSQPITAYVGHIRWQLLVAAYASANVDVMDTTYYKDHLSHSANLSCSLASMRQTVKQVFIGETLPPYGLQRAALVSRALQRVKTVPLFAPCRRDVLVECCRRDELTRWNVADRSLDVSWIMNRQPCAVPTSHVMTGARSRDVCRKNSTNCIRRHRRQKSNMYNTEEGWSVRTSGFRNYRLR